MISMIKRLGVHVSEGPSLQTVLGGKYGLPEPLVVEGRFVTIEGDEATSLVCLGLESECLVVASIVSNGSSMNYELQTLIPLSVLTISYNSSNQTIEVRSEFGDTIVFQLCSCENKTQIWDMFTTTIKELYQIKEHGESLSLTSISRLKPSMELVADDLELRPNVLHNRRHWYSDTSILRIYPKVTEVGPLKKFTPEENLRIEKKYPKVTPEFEIIAMFTSDETLTSSDSCSSILQIYANDVEFDYLEKNTSAESLWSTNTFVLRKYSKLSESKSQSKIKIVEFEGTNPKLIESSVSLPEKLPSQPSTWYPGIVVKFQSINSLNSVCDDSVIAEILLSLKDASINYKHRKTNTDKQQEKTKNKLVKFFRRLFLYCIGRK